MCSLLGGERLRTEDLGSHRHDKRVGTRKGALDRCRQPDRPGHVVSEDIDELVCMARQWSAQVDERCARERTDCSDSCQLVLEVGRVDQGETSGVNLAVDLVESFCGQRARACEDLEAKRVVSACGGGQARGSSRRRT